MIQLITFLIIGFVGIVVGYYLALSRHGSWKQRKTAGGKVKQTKKNAVENREEAKDENMRRLREYIAGRKEVANDEVERLLGISDSTATRYLDELEKEGLIRQLGHTGSGVRYKRLK